MKDLIIGVMLGGAAATAFLMTDCGCDFICATKKKLSGMCKCAEKVSYSANLWLQASW